MNKYVLTMVQQLVSPSVRYEIRRIASWLREQLDRAHFWKWEVARLSLRAESPYDIIYIGRKAQRDFAMSLLNAARDVDVSSAAGCEADRKVIISEIPFPGTLCIPALLSSIVPLGRTIEDVTSNFHSQLRRELPKKRKSYRMQQVLDSAEIERVDREMLRPYANARHGDDAAQIELGEVKRMAQKYGRLDLLLLGDEVVGCQQGHVIVRAGKRYWSTNRCGYPDAVFSDPKRLRDSNSMNIYLAMEWAIENGFDYYDIGSSLGRPGDGLLEWKRRRGGELDMMGNSTYFHIRLPKVGSAQFLWDAPLFAVERHKLTLHLGLPDGTRDEDAASRYREMGFGGLFKVYVHCTSEPSESLLETLRNFYISRVPVPMVKIILSN